MFIKVFPPLFPFKHALVFKQWFCFAINYNIEYIFVCKPQGTNLHPKNHPFKQCIIINSDVCCLHGFWQRRESFSFRATNTKVTQNSGERIKKTHVSGRIVDLYQTCSRFMPKMLIWTSQHLVLFMNHESTGTGIRDTGFKLATVLNEPAWIHILQYTFTSLFVFLQTKALFNKAAHPTAAACFPWKEPCSPSWTASCEHGLVKHFQWHLRKRDPLRNFNATHNSSALSSMCISNTPPKRSLNPNSLKSGAARFMYMNNFVWPTRKAFWSSKWLWQNTPVTTFSTANNVKLMKKTKRKTHQTETSLMGSKTSCQLTPPAMLMNKLNMQLLNEPRQGSGKSRHLEHRANPGTQKNSTYSPHLQTSLVRMCGVDKRLHWWWQVHWAMHKQQTMAYCNADPHVVDICTDNLHSDRHMWCFLQYTHSVADTQPGDLAGIRAVKQLPGHCFVLATCPRARVVPFELTCS